MLNKNKTPLWYIEGRWSSARLFVRSSSTRDCLCRNWHRPEASGVAATSSSRFSPSLWMRLLA